MRKEIRSAVNDIGLSLLYKGMALVTILVGLLVAALMMHLGRKWQSELVQGVGAVVFLLSFPVAIFTWREVIERMKQNPALLLLEALGQTLRGYAFYLSFFPVVGGLFARMVDPKNNRNPFASDGQDTDSTHK